MRKRITINLETPLEGHEGPIHKVVLREPNVVQCLRVGDPFVVGRSPSGAQLVVENSEAISEYVKICLVEPADPVLLEQGGVVLARQLKQAVMDFFLPADAAEAEASAN